MMYGKIELDKYYTSSNLAQYVVTKTNEIIDVDNITEYIEPSAGAGVFLEFLNRSYLAYDLEPENEKVIKQNYLELSLDYKKGRCIIGNPPYGKGNYTSVKFYKKAILQGDYISFILPISQLNNNMYMYEFDMIYSEDLGKRLYSGRKVHCVLNIYRRNYKGFNKKPSYDLEDVILKGVGRGKSRNDKVPNNYDFSISGFGASFGKLCDFENQYCQQIYFTVKPSLLSRVKGVILNADWVSMYGMTDTPTIKHWMINKYLSSKIEGIK